MNLVGRHGASLHIFACRPLVWSADCLDAMLRLSPRGEIAPRCATLMKERLALSRRNTRACKAQNDALGARLETSEHLSVMAPRKRGKPRCYWIARFRAVKKLKPSS